MKKPRDLKLIDGYAICFEEEKALDIDGTVHNLPAGVQIQTEILETRRDIKRLIKFLQKAEEFLYG